MTIHRSIAALVSAAALASCDYEKNAVQDITGVPPAAAVRFFNFSVGAPSVNFYANDTKMTAILTATCSGVTVSDTCKTTGGEATPGEPPDGASTASGVAIGYPLISVQACVHSE